MRAASRDPASVLVVGMDGRPLPDAVRTGLDSADLVVGAARHLAAAGLPDRVERVVLGPLEPAVARLREHRGHAVVLASGDPGFFGIVRRLVAENLPLRVLPAASSVSQAFARLGLPWDGAVVVSAHGRTLAPALNACRALPAVAVLTGPGAGPAELGAGLAGWPRRLVVAEGLGDDAERITCVEPAEAAGRSWPDTTVVLALAPGAFRGGGPRRSNQPAAAPNAGWALPESAYEHRNEMITKAEVRALVVARLRPTLGRLIWDVGAGSGAVAVECGALGAAAIAVERAAEDSARIARNAAAHQVSVRVVTGAAPVALDGLPDPDAVFVGGGGAPVLGAVAARRPATVVVALASLDRVAPALGLLRSAGYATDGVQLSAARLADLPGGSVRLAAANPVFVLTGRLP